MAPRRSASHVHVCAICHVVRWSLWCVCVVVLCFSAFALACFLFVLRVFCVWLAPGESFLFSQTGRRCWFSWPFELGLVRPLILSFFGLHAHTHMEKIV